MKTSLAKLYSATDLVVLKSTISDASAARILGRTTAQITNKRWRMRGDNQKRMNASSNSIHHHNNEESRKTAADSHQRWSDTDDSFVISSAASPIKDVAAALSRTCAAVRSRRHYLSNR
jgi:hypothetical protein